MTDIPDRELLAEFARNESEAAFAELVRRHMAATIPTHPLTLKLRASTKRRE